MSAGLGKASVATRPHGESARVVGIFVADLWPSTPPGLRVTFTLDQPEFLRAMSQSANADRYFWRAVVMSFIGLISGTVVIAVGYELVGAVLITIDCVILACLVYGYVGLPIQSWRVLENNRKQQTYQFSPDGVVEQLADHSAFVKWSVFTRVVETRDFYVFLVRGRRAIFLPKRGLDSPFDHKQFRELVRGHAPHRFKNPERAAR